MSSKNSSESMIAERRLRPIYDLLDFNNNKKAIQEADRVLKKSPDLDCAKVLKSLALLRLGRDADAEQLLETVAKRAPCDDPTLQAMTICYRELRLPDKICNIYEEAVKKDPTNEELLTHLFMSYVRVYNYKKQQHTAMSLYKLKSKNPYYFWAVMSIVMQTSKTEDNISKSITLPLAERMVKKFIDENRIDAEQEVQLYVIILEMQQKYQEVLDLLASPLGNMLQSYYTASQKKIDTLIAMKQWDQVNLYLKQELIVSDSWHNYVNYLTSVFHLVSTGSAIVPNDVTNSVNVPNDVTNRANVPNDSANVPNDVITSADLSFESCAQYLSILEEKKVALSHKSRAVHLVRLEFYVKLREHEKEIAANTNSTRSLPLADSVLGASLVDLLLSYYKMFGHTPCCLKDLQKYLAHLSPEEVNVFSDALWKMNNIEGKEEYVPTDRKSMLQFISCLQFNRYLGKYDNASLSVEAKISLIIRLTQTYYLCDAYTTDQAPAEIKANDAIILLVIYLLHDLYVLDSKYIHYILIYIHYVSTRNHYNFNLELLALHYYHRIGASGAAHMCYENLDMKHIQLDSLGYLHLGPLLSMAQFTLAAKVFDATLKFFTINYKDNADHLVLSYKFGSFLKIDEFHRFRQRLNNSIHYTLSTIEKMLLDILHVTSYNEVLSTVETMDVEPQVDNILWDELEDNRDLSVFNTCNPSHMKPDTHIQSLTYTHDLTHLRIRALLLRILVASIHIAHPPSPPAQQNGAPNEGEGDRVGVLRQLTEELASLYEGLVKEPPVQVPAEVQGAPPPSRLFFYLSHSFLPHFLAISRAVVELASQPEGPGFEAHMVQAVVYLKKDFEAVQEQFAAVSERGSWQNHRALIQTMSLFVEMIAITNIKCGAMAAILKANKSPNSRSKEQNAKKKKKHKKTQSGGGASEPSAENHVSGEVKDPVPILNNVLEITKELSRQVTGLTKSCEDLLDSHFQGNHSLNISQDTSEGRLVHALLAYEEPSQRTLVAKVENLRLDDGKNKKHAGRNSLPGDLLESEDPTRSPGRELDPAAEKDEEAKREALDGKKASVPAIESHCGGSCVHRRKLTWAECAVKVNENVMNSYKVSYNKIRLINLFKSFAQE